MIPPKNSTSVARKTHMPSCAVSLCWARVAYWKLGLGLGMGLAVLPQLIGIGLPDDDRGPCEIVLGRRRGRQPFEACRIPGIGPGALVDEAAPAEIEQRQGVGDRQDGRA